MKKGRLIPSMMKTSFLNTYPEEIPAPDQKRKNPRVAIFIGCL